MKSNLPPLAALVAFEAAGRLQSFTRAAAELNITQAAVSRQIRLLEEYLGRRLFVRAHRAVSLTNEGRDYLHTVVNALAHVGAATVELKSSPQTPKLTIAADQSMAAMWLVPRLQNFCSQNAGLAIRLLTGDDDEKILGAEVDMSLIHGNGDWMGHDATLLFKDSVVPVCSPKYLENCLGLQSPEQLLDQTLIDLEDDHWHWLNWRQWLTSQGVQLPTTSRGLAIDSYPLVVDAAVQGLGFALGWRGLVDSDLQSGRLVAPLACSVETSFGYYIAWTRRRKMTQEAALFLDWLLSECRGIKEM